MNNIKALLIWLMISLFSINAFAENAMTSAELIDKGDQAFAVGQFKQALIDYQNASPTAENTTALYIKIARCFQYIGIQSSALAVTDKILAETPDQIDALLIQGEIAEANENFEQALTLYQRAEKIDSTNRAVYHNQANVLRRMGRDSDAEKALSNIKKQIFK
ncbi:MAG TPA: hypothetical protein ENJ28_02990 [Gammaproteobacteria bacterium]|nr:hypothetical protein [Gammaproteobacteria bacterium]